MPIAYLNILKQTHATPTTFMEFGEKYYIEKCNNC